MRLVCIPTCWLGTLCANPCLQVYRKTSPREGFCLICGAAYKQDKLLAASLPKLPGRAWFFRVHSSCRHISNVSTCVTLV